MIKDKTDDLIIDFARRWARFGGGPADEIFVNFGLTPVAYFERLWKLLQTQPERCPIESRRLVSVICRQRLAKINTRQPEGSL